MGFKTCPIINADTEVVWLYGLVLEGGGAKGSYQIGAYKALKELGMEISAVTGTSIGALNGAMIVQGELEKAYELWYNISPSRVFDIEEARLEELRNLEITHDNFFYFMKKAKEIMQSRGIDITFIKKLLYEIIDENKLRNSNMVFGFVTVSLSDMKPLELFIEDVPKGKVVEYLLASANLPAFKQEKIDGKLFIDGGFYDNLPLNMLIRKGYKDIIAIRTKAMGRTRKINNPEVKVTYITTDENIGRILDFNQTQARRNLQLGYYDTLKKFRGLKGKKYYIKPTRDEEYFLRFFMAAGEERILQVGETLGLKNIPYRRLLFEHLIPKLNGLFDLGKESSYEDLAVAVLEFLASEYGVERFKIYSFAELLEEVRKKYLEKPLSKIIEELPRLPAFVRQSEVLSKAVRDRVIRELVGELFEDYILNPDLAH